MSNSIDYREKYRPTTSHLSYRSLVIPDSALRNGVHLQGGPGSGKSRMMGRIMGWQFFTRQQATVIIDPTGGTIDNFLAKVIAQKPHIQKELWPRVLYVDMASQDYISPWPLYYKMREDETLYTSSQRFLEVIRALDPYLQTASVEGWNALSEVGTYTGMILSALGLQVTEAIDLINRPQRWKVRFEEALSRYPEVLPAVSYFRALQNFKPEQRARRTKSFVNKLLPFTADPSMQAMFGAPRQRIIWQEVVDTGRIVLLDFRAETTLERRRFKMMWCLSNLIEFVKHRGFSGRSQPIALFIDEVTQLLGFRTLEQSVMAEMLEELVSVLARNYGVHLVIAHQNLSQLDERIKNVLMQMGTQIIGVVTNPEDALYLSDQFLRYDPMRVKKREPVWMGISQMGLLGTYTQPTVIDQRDIEYTPEEQRLMMSSEFMKLQRFEFLTRIAKREGEISGTVSRMSIADLDRGIYPDEELVSQARTLLTQRDGILKEKLLASTEASFSAGEQVKTDTSVATIKEYAHDIQVPAKDNKRDDEEIILREEA